MEAVFDHQDWEEPREPVPLLGVQAQEGWEDREEQTLLRPGREGIGAVRRSPHYALDAQDEPRPDSGVLSRPHRSQRDVLPAKLFSNHHPKALVAKIAVIVGSVRRDRHGALVANWIKGKLERRGHEVLLVDPLELNLPILDRTFEEMEDPPEKLRELKRKVVEAEGYIAVTSEYNHGVPAAMKNTLDYIEEGYSFKPSAVISYSTGPLGAARVVEQMRLIFAGLKAPTIPSSVSIPSVHKAFDDDGRLRDTAHDESVNGFLDEFEWYVEAMKAQRIIGTPY